ncbi:MAG: hypothetical protein ACOCX3_01155 [Chloroflexota bacterium]
MPQNNHRRSGYLDENKAFSGFMWGLIIGAAVAFFRGPRINIKSLSPPSLKGKQGERTMSAPDSLEASIEEGKLAARRRRENLGL